MIYWFNSNKLFLYDLDREKKFVIDTPPKELFPTKNFPTIIWRDQIVVCGGSSTENINMKNNISFDLANLEFIQRRPMSSGRFKHTLVTLGTHLVYIWGGLRGKYAIRDWCKYNMDTDYW